MKIRLEVLIDVDTVHKGITISEFPFAEMLCTSIRNNIFDHTNILGILISEADVEHKPFSRVVEKSNV